jgi:hypothetical protein
VSNNQSLTSSSSGGNGSGSCGTNMKNVSIFRSDVEVFTGFKPAIEACYMDWEDYPLPGITYTSGVSRLYHCPFTCFRHAGDSPRAESLVVNQVRIDSKISVCRIWGGGGGWWLFIHQIEVFTKDGYAKLHEEIVHFLVRLTYG